MSGGTGGATRLWPATSTTPVAVSLSVAGTDQSKNARHGRDGQAKIHAVSVEDASEALPDDAAYAPCLHGQLDVFPRRSTAEVLARYQDGVVPYLADHGRVQPLKQMPLHVFRVEDVQVAARIQNVRVDIVLAHDECRSLDDHVSGPESRSAGLTISPATAAQAATYAFAR